MAANATSSLPPGLSLPTTFNTTLGAILIGGIACAVLYGVTCLQTLIYYQKYSSDRLAIKLMVAGLWLLDTFDFILTSDVLYWYLVQNYINPLALLKPVWSLILHVAITSLTDFVVRCMFARRIWKLSNRNYVLTAFTVSVSFVDLVVGIIITVKAFQVQTFLELITIANLFYLNFAAGLSGDIIVAVALTYFLWTSRTGFKKTNTLIEKLIIYVMSTGALTALDAILGLVMYAIFPNNFIFIAFYLQLSKLYLNSYLASLNLRRKLQNESKPGSGLVSIHLSQLSQDVFNGNPSGTRTFQSSSTDDKPYNVVRVQVDTSFHTQDDTLMDGNSPSVYREEDKDRDTESIATSMPRSPV